jgi:hypothetical protein
MICQPRLELHAWIREWYIFMRQACFRRAATSGSLKGHVKNVVNHFHGGMSPCRQGDENQSRSHSESECAKERHEKKLKDRLRGGRNKVGEGTISSHCDKSTAWAVDIFLGLPLPNGCLFIYSSIIVTISTPSGKHMDNYHSLNNIMPIKSTIIGFWKI